MFIAFHEPAGQLVYVNRDQVVTVRPHDPEGNSCRIDLANAQTLIVIGSAAEVTGKLGQSETGLHTFE